MRENYPISIKKLTEQGILLLSEFKKRDALALSKVSIVPLITQSISIDHNHAPETVRHTTQNVRHEMKILWRTRYFSSMSLLEKLGRKL